MKKILFLSIALLLIGIFGALARADEGDADRVAVKKFLKALKAHDKTAVAKLVQYPFERPKPLLPLKKPGDFVAVYDQYFDDRTVQTVIQDAAGEPIERNGQFGTSSGTIWFQEGRIVAINLHTEKFTEAFTQAKQKENIHSSAAGFDQLNLECWTPKFHIRIETFGEKVKYFSWAKTAKISEKPDLVLTGTVDYDGSAGNATYTFKSGTITYAIDAPTVCESEDPATGSCPIELAVSDKSKSLYSARCGVRP